MGQNSIKSVKYIEKRAIYRSYFLFLNKSTIFASLFDAHTRDIHYVTIVVLLV